MDEMLPESDALAALPEMEAILAGYEEARRRDTLVETEKWHWKVATFVVSVGLVLALMIVLWLVLTQRKVDAFVQVVQVVDGKALPLGVPVDLLAYEPDEGLWLDMLGQWIRNMRWRGIDPQLAQAEWTWVYGHTCGAARKVLQHVEDTEKPFVLGKKQTSVVLASITKTPAPRSYHAQWEEWVTERNQQPVVQRYVGTFTVGRLRPRDQAAVLANRLGLCVSAFDISVQPDK